MGPFRAFQEAAWQIEELMMILLHYKEHLTLEKPCNYTRRERTIRLTNLVLIRLGVSRPGQKKKYGESRAFWIRPGI